MNTLLSAIFKFCTTSQRVAKERAAQRVRSWTVNTEMRSVLERVSASAAGRILDSANSKLIGCVRCSEDERDCTNQQPPQRGGAVPDPVWVRSKWLLAFPRVPVTPGTPLHFFAMLPSEGPQKGSTQLLQNRLPVFSFLLPFFDSSFFSFS